jgi:putative SOS response-associated peptidase YedK
MSVRWCDMCNLYTVGGKDEIANHFRGVVPSGPYKPTIAPLGVAPVIVGPWALKMGQWGMIPWRSATRVRTTSKGTRMSTNNARRETIATAFTYRDSWVKGKRC